MSSNIIHPPIENEVKFLSHFITHTHTHNIKSVLLDIFMIINKMGSEVCERSISAERKYICQ